MQTSLCSILDVAQSNEIQNGKFSLLTLKEYLKQEVRGLISCCILKAYEVFSIGAFENTVPISADSVSCRPTPVCLLTYSC